MIRHMPQYDEGNGFVTWPKGVADYEETGEGGMAVLAVVPEDMAWSETKEHTRA